MALLCGAAAGHSVGWAGMWRGARQFRAAVRLMHAQRLGLHSVLAPFLIVPLVKLLSHPQSRASGGDAGGRGCQRCDA